ncbi:trypsin-like peptidase domain-containing protein [candidate division KSB1 bacterium]|nr:trypsin-like peptidase domain-containing protein [candidate division KSB1 bacterium]
MTRIKAPLFFFVLGIAVGIIVWAKLTEKQEAPLFQTSSNFQIASASETPQIREATASAPVSNAGSRENAITRAVERVSPAVVGINVIQIREYRPGGFFSDDPVFRNFFPELRQRELVKGLGSGLILSPDGYIVTNEHVIHDATEVIVTLPDKTKYNADIVAADFKTDLALLKIKDGRNFPFAILGDSDDLIIGEWAIAFGNPFGLFDLGAHPSVSQGIISAIDRDFGKQDHNRVYQDMIQTDASINGGNSGGPLVNCLGEVIGVNTFIYSGSDNMTTSIGLGFAIPINRVKKVVSDLKKFGKVNRSFWTGLEVQELNYLIARYLGKKDVNGVIISDIEQNSPAGKANLQVGDIIVEVNDTKISSTKDIWNIIENMDAKGGDVLKLKIFRNQNYMTVNIQLEKIPE